MLNVCQDLPVFCGPSRVVGVWPTVAKGPSAELTLPRRSAKASDRKKKLPQKSCLQICHKNLKPYKQNTETFILTAFTM